MAGRDGKELARLISKAKDDGATLLWQLFRESLKGYSGRGPVLDPIRVKKLSESLASVNSTAELMGRVRVREMAERATAAGGLSKFSDTPFSTFADTMPGVIATPEEAVAYFSSLTPTLGIDPERFADEQRRRAFTLAVSTNKTLTERVQASIAESLRSNKSVADATREISKALDEAGATTPHPQYGEMVYRTNANDAFQTGVYEEGRHADVTELFPVYRYLIVDDLRTGDDHRPKGGKYYAAEVPFAQARGDRPFNCRCSMQWVDMMDWRDLQSRGAKIERNWH